MIRSHVLICGGTGCTSSHSQEIMAAMTEEIKAVGLQDEVQVVQTGCFGLCALGPIMVIYPEGAFYARVTEEDVKEIVNEHLLKGRIVDRLIYKDAGEESDKAKSLSETQFYRKQKRVALRNCGVIDPEKIDEYIGVDGYAALGKVLTEMTPQQVIDEILASGLRGRGGGGFPTGRKWQFAANSVSNQKYVVCNADEGDPGAFMDRAIIESDPHTLIEGMLIGAYAIGAGECIVYVRAEYPLAIIRLENAIKEAEEKGFIGKNICGTDFSCSFRIKAGAGAFVCGEETALIESLEGERGMPRLKPPFPAEAGYWYKPSNINNVETFANVAWIILNSGEEFSKLGTENSKGTKVFALTGKIKRGGLVEIPMGKTLRDVIFDIGGGIRNNGKFKAVQLGGPSGGCIPEEYLDTIIDYKSLSATGAIMGSGGMVVMDENTCMVNMAKFFLDFTTKESCGKCVHCRIGTKRMYEILDRIVSGNGEDGDIELLEELCLGIKDGALCGLGQTAPNPVLTTIKYFRDEYVAHIVDKKCPAKECIVLLDYTINEDKCIGCSLCSKKCPVNAISGEVKKSFAIDSEKCIKCGQCKSVCRFGAVEIN